MNKVSYNRLTRINSQFRMYFIRKPQQPFIIFKQSVRMEFVAQKLGFLRYEHKPVPAGNQGQVPARIKDTSEDLRGDRERKLSQDDSSSTSSIGMSKLKITDTSDSDPNQSKLITMPIPIRMNQGETKSLGIFPETVDFNTLMARFHMSAFDHMPNFSFQNDFYNNQYLSSLVAPYGTPIKFIGPITEFQRKQKVTKYLQKKKNRKWKNVKYNVRKELAENRKREQGRFVKSERKWRWNEIGTTEVDDQEKLGEKETKVEGEVKMEQE